MDNGKINEVRINVPEGMEIDKENSTFECIRFKKKSDIMDGFKKGDFLYVQSKSGDEWYFIFSGVKKKSVNGEDGYVMVMCYMNDCYLKVAIPFTKLTEKSSIDVIRYATVAEKQLMLERLDEKGWEWDAEKLEIKKKPGLPKTWEEFCKTHPIGTNECYIDSCSYISERCGNERFDDSDRNILPNKETAEAFLALIQLIQLRDCYNEGWRPDWKEALESKYCICSYKQNLKSDTYHSTSLILAFKTAELRDQFLENFRDLIEVAKPLI